MNIFEGVSDEERKLLELPPDTYNPATPNNFDELYTEIKGRQHIRILKKRHQKTQQQLKQSLTNQKNSGGSSSGPSKDHVGMKIMNKYGFKPGQGLGKDEQGMMKPLEVQKIGKTMGKIIGDEPVEAPAETNTNDSEYSNAEIFKKPTCILLLRNFIDHNEEDSILREDIKSECLKYGMVVSAHVHKVICSMQSTKILETLEYKAK